MRLSRQPLFRFAVTLGICLGSVIIVCGLTSGAERIPIHFYSAIERRLMAASNKKVEQQYPRGSQVFSTDSYEIDDGPNSLSVTVDTTFRRDLRGRLSITDMGSGYTWTFSEHAVIERKNNSGEQVVRPGEKPGAILRGLILIRGARLVKILS